MAHSIKNAGLDLWKPVNIIVKLYDKRTDVDVLRNQILNKNVSFYSVTAGLRACARSLGSCKYSGRMLDSTY